MVYRSSVLYGAIPGMYNVVEKLRTGEALTEKERQIREVAACGVLRELHGELDRLVVDAYGWPWPMETSGVDLMQVLQGPLADAMTHVGQLAMLRRLAGHPVEPENFMRARIEASNTIEDQPSPISPGRRDGSGAAPLSN